MKTLRKRIILILGKTYILYIGYHPPPFPQPGTKDPPCLLPWSLGQYAAGTGYCPSHLHFNIQYQRGYIKLHYFHHKRAVSLIYALSAFSYGLVLFSSKHIHVLTMSHCFAQSIGRNYLSLSLLWPVLVKNTW